MTFYRIEYTKSVAKNQEDATDTVDNSVRSRMMAGIRSTNTRPELVLRKALHAKGFRFRLHSRGIPGRPDIVLRKFGAVIFVHGCFWHQHDGCRHATMPSTRKEFWQRKLCENRARDQLTLARLSEQKMRVAVVWECALRKPEQVASAAFALANWLRSDKPNIEIDQSLD